MGSLYFGNYAGVDVDVKTHKTVIFLQGFFNFYIQYTPMIDMCANFLFAYNCATFFIKYKR